MSSVKSVVVKKGSRIQFLQTVKFCSAAANYCSMAVGTSFQGCWNVFAENKGAALEVVKVVEVVERW